MWPVVLDILCKIITFILLLNVGFYIYTFKESRSKFLNAILLYLVFSFVFDISSYITTPLVRYGIITDTVFCTLLFKIIELYSIGTLFTKSILPKFKYGKSLVYVGLGILFYELVTYKFYGLENYIGFGQIYTNILLFFLSSKYLIREIRLPNKPHMKHIFFSLVFFFNFCMQIVYSIANNFIINIGFDHNKVIKVYISFAVLFIMYYSALTVLVYTYRNKYLKKEISKAI